MHNACLACGVSKQSLKPHTMEQIGPFKAWTFQRMAPCLSDELTDELHFRGVCKQDQTAFAGLDAALRNLSIQSGLGSDRTWLMHEESRSYQLVQVVTLEVMIRNWRAGEIDSTRLTLNLACRWSGGSGA